jgi:xylan 1,4-beta-xylosidase
MQRTGHGSLVIAQNGQMFVAYLCGRPITEKSRCTLGRETCICEVVWDENGWLRLKNGGEVPPKEYSVDLPEHKFPPIPQKDTFNIKELPPHLNTLRIPLNEIGSLTEREGYLRLYGNESITSWNRQSMVARRLQHHNAEATIKMEFHPQTFQQMAGLTVFYDTYNFYYLYMSTNEMGHNVLRMCVRDGLKFSNPLNGAINIGDHSEIYLRASIKNLKLNFYYSFDNLNYYSAGSDLNIASLSDEAYGEIGHEGHTGTFIGMACQDLTGNHNYADFEYLEYKGK